MNLPVDPQPRKKHLPLAGGPAKGVDADLEAELRRFEAEERKRLGLHEEREHWVEKMATAVFTRSEKAKVTLLVGGLTMAHDYLVQGALRGLGYHTVALDCPDEDALRYGKEFGNRGQCNPTYFTVGNLVKFLTHLRDEKGLATREIVERFVFLTAGACGPCRFGMYVTEYRKALRDAGFDGFRVLLFQQQGGLSQATGEESGLEFGPPFFLALLQALIAGDVLNGVTYRLRPYEVEPGATDRAMEQAKRLVHDTLARRGNVLAALIRARRLFAAVEVDRTRLKPRVAIIGEFWAMTTEGDGNYKLQRFLEQEGAECDIQFVSAWILYNIWEVKFDTAQRAALRGKDGGRTGLAGKGDSAVFVRQVSLLLADRLLRAAFYTFAWCGGFHGYHLPDMDEIAEVAHQHYDNDLRGGEGHMEVGKLILNVVHQKATMTLSVKPFGCMPSSAVSDGVQSLITERYPGTIFCPVETSGDGAVNFQSRVQMYLFKARQAAEAEYRRVLQEEGLEEADVAALLRRHPRLARGLHRPPHAGTTTLVDLVRELARVNRPLPERAHAFASRAASGLRRLGTRAVMEGPARLRAAAALVGRASAELAELARDEGPGALRAAGRRARAQLRAVQGEISRRSLSRLMGEPAAGTSVAAAAG